MSWDSPVKRSARSSPRPIVLPSMIPETDSDSATSALMSASRRCCSVVIRRRILPTLRVIQNRRRHEDQRDHRQPPVQDAHRDDRADHGRDVRGDRRRGVGDDVVQAADVVGDPRLHLTGARAREERERHLLQAVVDGGAQVVHHLLADDVRDVGLPDARRLRDEGDADHPEHRLGQDRSVVPEEPVVQRPLDQERVEHADPRGEHDQRQHDAEPLAVRPEQAQDPAPVALARRIHQPGRLLLGVAELPHGAAPASAVHRSHTSVLLCSYAS